MQVESLGWAIDDILLTAGFSPEDQQYLAISCKSSMQVTASKLPPSFVAQCWRQWAKAEPNPMRRGKDKMLLATRGRNDKFMTTWSDLKTAAEGSDPRLALARIKATAKHEKMFESVREPAEKAGVIVKDEDVLSMIASIDVAPLDFQTVPSEDQARAIAELRRLLVHDTLQEGERFWRELLSQARKVRLGSGTLDVSSLWKSLRSRYKLKGFPGFESSWTALRALTEEQKKSIEAVFSSGLSVDRSVEECQLLTEMRAGNVCIVFGESGTGKSALVMTTLNEYFSKSTHIWLGPENLEQAVSEAKRTDIGIDEPLVDVLHMSTDAENILVIDAAERLSPACVSKAKSLVNDLLDKDTTCLNGGWRVVIIGQVEAWTNGTFQELAGEVSPRIWEVEALAIETVEHVLRSVRGLEWLVSHGDAVAALTNLRTLAWVIQAAEQFRGEGSGASPSLTAIADRLWTHWTGGKVSVERLLMKLAEREAQFEHSFAVSELDSGDATVLDDLPVACPLRRDKESGRIRFQHDLAADWARFRRLKEIADDTSQWSHFATNPSWHSALRMLGQYLLRQQCGTRSAWHVAFEATEQGSADAPLAVDILLDALFLDPSAERFLNEHGEVLLANGGTRLLRLVIRFEHVATMPGTGIASQGYFGDLSLYLESSFRTPIFARWPAMARFLARNRAAVESLMSPAIATLCERWLTGTPTLLTDNTKVPFRLEFAELALGSARKLQLERAKHLFHGGDSNTHIFRAALAGAPDLPSEVCEWALEMAQRRAYPADIVAEIRAHHERRAAEHERRMKSDSDYRAKHHRLWSSASISSFREKLPPWPLGPQHRIEQGFREAVLRSPNFQALMRSNANIAGEVLLACIVESEPEDGFDSSLSAEDELAIEYDRETYPTAPWKSPFYSFLRIDPDVALDTLQRLVNFASHRWLEASRKKTGLPPEPLSVRLTDGSFKEYIGNAWVFGWSQENSLSVGQLYSALAALERWLCDLIDEGEDVTTEIQTILRQTDSVAVLGVLINVGKHAPQIFKGPLLPLLGLQDIYEWDSRRTNQNTLAFDSLNWANSGEVFFEMAKKWVFSPYRTKKLREVAAELVVEDRKLGDFVLDMTRGWSLPSSQKGSLEQRILIAELDYRHYSLEFDPETKKEVRTLRFPSDLSIAIQKFNDDRKWIRQALTFPDTCQKILMQDRLLTKDEAEETAALMMALSDDGEIKLEKEWLLAPRVAAAVLLSVRASNWLVENVHVQKQAQSIINTAIDDLEDKAAEDNRDLSIAHSHLVFVVHWAISRWLVRRTKEHDDLILRLLTSGDYAAVRVLAVLAYRNRTSHGSCWRRLMYLALLWSALSSLKPRYGDGQEVEQRWRRWRQWYWSRSLSEDAEWTSIDPLSVAKRSERLALRRWERRHARKDVEYRRIGPRRLSVGLDTHFLECAFSWLFQEELEAKNSGQEIEEHRDLVLALWAHQAWWISGSADKEEDDFPLMESLGYKVLEEMARLMVSCSPDICVQLWRSVLALGPRGHYAIRHFLTAWFTQLGDDTEIAEFGRRWRPMIEFLILGDEWREGGFWYHEERLERMVLGFESAAHLTRVQDHSKLVGMMRDLYSCWAKKRLGQNEDNLAGFCAFLGSAVGGPLRFDGLKWIADAMRKKSIVGDWYRDYTSSAFVEFLHVLVLEHAKELREDGIARQALLDLSAHAASRQLKTSLALHERIRRL